MAHILAVLAMTTCAAADDEAFRIVALGDSVTKGVRPGVTAEQTFEARLEEALKPQFPHVRVLNEGVGGNTVRHAWTRIHSSVVEKQPAFCTLMFGINDSYFDESKTEPRIAAEEFETRLRGFVGFLRHHGIEPVLMTPNPMTSRVKASQREPFAGQPKGMNFMLEVYCDLTRRVARDLDVPLIDIYQAFWDEAGGKEDGVNRLLTDGMHPNPAGHQVIADRLSAFFKDALAGRGGRPLPSARAAENRRKADEALAGLRFRVHAVCDGATPLSAAKPPWSPVPRELESLMRVEDGALCFSNLAAETRRPLSFTLNLPAKEGAQALTFTARTTARSQEAPYLSFGDGRTKVWAWVFADRFVVSRHDATKDRIEVRLDGTAYRQYRLVLNGMDLYVFVDDMTKPARVAPGWLVPGWREGRYAQLGLGVGGKACECQWRGIEVAFAEP